MSEFTEAEVRPVLGRFKSKFHKDGTVTYWDVFRQQWQRRQQPTAISNENLAAMSVRDRRRTLNRRYQGA